MLYKTKGIVLHYIKYAETSIITTIYTQHAGRQKYIVNGVRKHHSKNRLSMFRPLTQLNMEVYHKEKNNIQRIKELQFGEIYQSIYFNTIKNTVSFFLSEILYHVLKEEEPNHELYEFLSNAFILFDLDDKIYVNFHIFFLVKLTKYIGFLPLTHKDGKNIYFDMKEGRFREHTPRHPFYLDKKQSSTLYHILYNNFESLKKVKLNNSERRELLNRIIEYYNLHIEGLSEIRSFKVLTEIFNEEL